MTTTSPLPRFLRPVLITGLVVVGLLATGLMTSAPAHAQVTVDLVMTDGTRLATDVYAPTSEPRPVVVVRTPLGRERLAQWAMERAETLGATVVVQDVRGRGASEGEYDFFASAESDGQDTIGWLDTLGWSDGRVVMAGGTMDAIAGLLAAPGASDVLTCLDLESASASVIATSVYEGGVRRTEWDVWAEQTGAASLIEAFNDTPDPADAVWAGAQMSTGEAGTASVPGLHITGWFDPFQVGAIDAFAALDAQGGAGAAGTQRLIVGPWGLDRAMNDGRLYGGVDSAAAAAVESDWQWSHWAECVGVEGLAGLGEEAAAATSTWSSLPKARVYVLGPDVLPDPFSGEQAGPGNEWVELDSWPPPAIQTELNLRGGMQLGPDGAGDDELSVPLAYDPASPPPAVGGRHLFGKSGSRDQLDVQSRDDVLNYTSPSLDVDVTVIGRMTASIWVLTDAEEVDVAVTLSDVGPGGQALLIASGIRRLQGQDKPVEAVIDLGWMAYALAADHQLRVTISGALAGPMETLETPFEVLIATSPSFPSRVQLPVTEGSFPLVGVVDLPGEDIGGSDAGSDVGQPDATSDAGASSDASDAGGTEEVIDHDANGSAEDSASSDTAGADAGPTPDDIAGQSDGSPVGQDASLGGLETLLGADALLGADLGGLGGFTDTGLGGGGKSSGCAASDGAVGGRSPDGQLWLLLAGLSVLWLRRWPEAVGAMSAGSDRHV